MAKEPIVVIGFGWVGQANAIALSKMGYPVSFFDPVTPPHHHTRYEAEYARLTPLTDPRGADTKETCYIVCVGDKVAEDGTQDLSLIQKALEGLKGVQGTVILRSTIIPDSLAALPFDFYLPEFLHEKKAVEEILEPYLFVTGKKTDKKEPSFFATWRELAYKTFDGTPEEASSLKYLSNLWNSVRIAFVNEFGNAVALPEDKEKLASIEKLVNFMFDHRSYMRYGRSFGGHCLPKDTRAFVRAGKMKGRDMSMLEGVYQSNKAHEAIEKKYAILPEWFSEWPDPHISAKTALGSLAHSARKFLGF